MAKKYFQTALSVGLSLALCASMVAPGFAATFKELQGAIDSGNSVLRGDTVDESKSDAENYKIKVEAGKDDGGNDTRVVILYEDVENARRPVYGEQNNNSQEPGIVIGSGKNVTLNLNGHDINMNPGWELIDGDSEMVVTYPGTYEDDAEHQVGGGGYGAPGGNEILNGGSAVTVESDAKLTLKDSQGKWVYGSDDVPQYQGGKITGATWGGICQDHYDAFKYSGVYNKGTLIMNGGMISGNGGGSGSEAYGGVTNEGSFILNDGAVSNNRGGVIIQNGGTFTMNGGQISDNRGGARAAVEVGSNDNSSFTMNGGIISGNYTRYDDGCVQSRGDTSITINSGIFSGNKIYQPAGYDSETGKDIYDLEDDPYNLKGSGTTNLPAGSKIVKDGVETTYPEGATIDKFGHITGKAGPITKTDKEDGTTDVTVTGEDGNKTTINVPTDKRDDVTIGDDGTITVPAGGKITDKDGNETTYPDGTTISKDGTVNGEKENGTTDPSVTKDKDGNVTIDDGQGNQTNVDVPDGTNPDDVKVDKNGTTEVPAGTIVTGKDGNKTELPNGGKVDKDGNVTGNPAITDKGDGTTDVTFTDEDGNKTNVNVPTDKKDDVKVNEDGSIDVPAGGKVTGKDENGDDTTTDLPYGGKVNPDGTVTPNRNPNAGGGTGVTGSTDVVVIDGVEVPLAGLVSVEDVLDVLYRLTEGVEGERDEVVAWAIENGIIDEETDVEELVTVAALRAILANYARAFELNVDVNTLATLTGEDDDIVMNCDEVIGEFFAKAEEDEAA